jgi:hypothetical protein
MACRGRWRIAAGQSPDTLLAPLTVLTIATAWFGDGLIKRTRTVGRHIGWASAVILWAAGAYVVYYWLTSARLL